MNLNDIKIEITSATIRENKGVSKRTGNEYHIATQEAYLHHGTAYPDRAEIPAIRSADRQSFMAYPVGFYGLTASHIVVREGRIVIDLYAAPLVSLPSPEAAAKPVKAA